MGRKGAFFSISIGHTYKHLLILPHLRWHQDCLLLKSLASMEFAAQDRNTLYLFALHCTSLHQMLDICEIDISGREYRRVRMRGKVRKRGRGEDA